MSKMTIKKAMIRKTAKAEGLISNQLSTYLDLPLNEDAETLTMDDDLKSMLKILLYPGNIANIALTTRAGGMANTTVCVDQDFTLAAGMGKEDIFLERMETEAFVGKFVGYFDNDAQLQFLETSLELSTNALYALLSTVDRLRFNRLLAMLEHQEEKLSLTVADIKAMMVDTIDNPDPRWLLANVLAVDQIDQEFDLQAGIEELRGIGIFKGGEDLTLSIEGMKLVAGLMELETFCGLKSFYYDSEKLTTVTMVVFRTRSFLWAIELNEDKALLYALNFETAALSLFSLLNRGDYSDGPYLEEEKEEEVSNDQGGDEIKLEKDQIESLVCQNCGRQLKAGLKFCTSCGSPVSQSGKLCPNCNAAITENDKFCKKCGQAL